MSDWSIVGPRPIQPRPSWTAAGLAIVFAVTVMFDAPSVYPTYMSLLAFAGAGFALVQGVKARAGIAFAFPIVALAWLNPLFGGDWFTRDGWEFFFTHTTLSLMFATAAYTYMAEEKYG